MEMSRRRTTMEFSKWFISKQFVCNLSAAVFGCLCPSLCWLQAVWGDIWV